MALNQLNDLRFEKVVFRHTTAHQNAMDGISFSVQTGDTIAFVGPSGSGKSTLVKLLVGLYKPQEGMIYFNDIRLLPISVFNPFPVRMTRLEAAALSMAASMSSSVASGFTKSRFSWMVPAKSWVSLRSNQSAGAIHYTG